LHAGKVAMTTDQTPLACPSCGGETRADEVSLAVWQGARLVVIRDVPATVCPTCGEQLFEEATNDAILALTEAGFPRSEAWEEIVVQVYRLPQPATHPGAAARTSNNA
jgi:YgiT-type zinc finger domain-containing protein